MHVWCILGNNITRLGNPSVRMANMFYTSAWWLLTSAPLYSVCHPHDKKKKKQWTTKLKPQCGLQADSTTHLDQSYESKLTVSMFNKAEFLVRLPSPSLDLSHHLSTNYSSRSMQWVQTVRLYVWQTKRTVTNYLPALPSNPDHLCLPTTRRDESNESKLAGSTFYIDDFLCPPPTT